MTVNSETECKQIEEQNDQSEPDDLDTKTTSTNREVDFMNESNSLVVIKPSQEVETQDAAGTGNFNFVIIGDSGQETQYSDRIVKIEDLSVNNCVEGDNHSNTSEVFAGAPADEQANVVTHLDEATGALVVVNQLPVAPEVSDDVTVASKRRRIDTRLAPDGKVNIEIVS